MKINLKFVFLFFVSIIAAQDGFHLSHHQKSKIPFQFINNQIVIDVVINNTPLKFIVDTGVEETLIFSLDDKNDLQIFNPKPVKFKGLGSNKTVEGIKSENNKIQIGKHFIDESHTLYIIVDQDIDLTSSMGIAINGIIGYHFFKNYAVEIDYSAKKIFLHQAHSKKLLKRQKNYKRHDILLLKNKPFLNTTITFDDDSETGNFLLDTGNSDIIWLFNQSFLKNRKKKLFDFLGKGFSGDVNGYRFRLKQVEVKNHLFKMPILVIPDSVSIQNINYVENRKGSLGSGYISRFDVIFDYKNEKFYTRDTNRLNLPFKFNRSGLDIVLGGTALISEKVNLGVTNSYGTNTTGSNVVFDINAMGSKMVEKPIYVIQNVREESMAFKLGVKKGDILESISGKIAKNLSLQDITQMLHDENKKNIKLTLSRKGRTFEVDLILEDFL